MLLESANAPDEAEDKEGDTHGDDDGGRDKGVVRRNERLVVLVLNEHPAPDEDQPGRCRLQHTGQR